MRRTMLLFIALLAIVGAPGFTPAGAPEEAPPARAKTFRSFLGKQPPEIEIAAGRWTGGREAVTLASLKGKIVWLEFIGSVA